MLEQLDGCHQYNSENDYPDHFDHVLNQFNDIPGGWWWDFLWLWHVTPCNFDFYNLQSCAYDLMSWKGTLPYFCFYRSLISFPFKVESQLLHCRFTCDFACHLALSCIRVLELVYVVFLKWDNKSLTDVVKAHYLFIFNDHFEPWWDLTIHVFFLFL